MICSGDEGRGGAKGNMKDIDPTNLLACNIYCRTART